MGLSRFCGWILLALCVATASADRLALRPCDNLGRRGTNITDVSLSNTYLGEQLTLKFRLNTDRPLRSADLHLEIVAAGSRLPCYRLTEAGSCTYSLCGKREYEIESKICKGWNCVCPIRPGSYMDKAGVQIELPNVPSPYADFVLQEDTQITFRLTNEGVPLFCGSGKIRVKTRDTSYALDGNYALTNTWPF